MKLENSLIFFSLLFSYLITATEIELLQDVRFKKGVNLLAPTLCKRVVIKKLQKQDCNDNPKWFLCQWNSKFSLTNALGIKLSAGEIIFSNIVKTIIFGNDNCQSADIVLGIDSRLEFGNQVRKKGEPWTHLLVEQDEIKTIYFKNIDKVQMHLEAKLLRNEKFKVKGYSSKLHCAQFLLTLIIQNRNKNSSGYGDFIWFNVQIFDDRTRFPPFYANQDIASPSGKFIYGAATKCFTEKSLHDGKWVIFSKDLMPFLKKGLEIARKKGFLIQSTNDDDFAISTVILGWEVPGINNVLMQVRNMSLKVLPRVINLKNAVEIVGFDSN